MIKPPFLSTGLLWLFARLLRYLPQGDFGPVLATLEASLPYVIGRPSTRSVNGCAKREKIKFPYPLVLSVGPGTSNTTAYDCAQRGLISVRGAAYPSRLLGKPYI